MPLYILDTNILTDLEYPDTPAYHIIMNKIASLELDAVVVSDDQIFKKIKEFYPSLHFENWKEG